MKSDKYIPINCGLYDQLEAFAVKRKLIIMEIQANSVIETLSDIRFIDFKTQKDGEFGILKSDQKDYKIRLDKIITINGKNLKDEFGESCALLA